MVHSERVNEGSLMKGYLSGVGKVKINQQRIMKHSKTSNSRGPFTTPRPKGTSGGGSYWDPERVP